MSAKELTIFIPKSSSMEPWLADLASGLSMDIDDLSSTPGLSYQFSARRGEGRSLLFLEYRRDDSRLIHEMSQWGRPTKAYKDLLQACQASVTLYFRNSAHAKEALSAIGLGLKNSCGASMVDNGLGCLLKLESILDAMHQDAQWSWERYEFPELLEVISSEWR